MAFVGMDTDLANTQAGQLQTQGVDGLQNLITSVDNLITQISDNWKGADATGFASEWQSSHRAQLMTIHGALTTFHGTFTRNIADQVATSGS